MRKFIKVLPVLLLFVVLAFASCSKSSDGNGGGTGMNSHFYLELGQVKTLIPVMRRLISE